VTIKYSDLKLTQNNANADPQKCKVTPNFLPKFGQIVHTTHVAEPNIRPKFGVCTCL